MPGKEFGSFCIFTNKESLFVHLSINIWLPWLLGFPPLSFSGAYPLLASQITLTKTCQLVLSTSKGNSRYVKSSLKVSKYQKHFFLKLHCPKNERNIRQNSALESRNCLNWKNNGSFMNYLCNYVKYLDPN